MKLLVILFIALSMLSTSAEAGRGGSSFSSSGRSSSFSGSRSSSSSSYSRSGSSSSRSLYSAGSTSRNSASALRSRSSGSGFSGLSARTTRTATGSFRTTDSGAQVRVSVPPATASRLFAARVAGSSAAGFRTLSYRPGQGTLPVSPAKPSERLQTIIREREVRSGPGWFGTAALIWLLSQHDLSDSDRAWITSQLSSGNDGGGQDISVDRITKTLTFTWDGLPEAAKVGEPVKIVVSAVDAKGHHQALDCSITNGSASTTLTDKGVVVTWTPATAGTGFLQCDSLSEGERRAVPVAL